MPRPDVSEERRNQVIDAAVKVFSRFGFNKASMENIADEAAMSKGLLYWYFKSKDALIGAILKRFFTMEQPDLKILENKEVSATERLLSYNEALLEKSRYLALLMPVAMEFYALAARQEDIRVLLRGYFKVYREKFASLIQEGIERNEFTPVDPMEAATTILAQYEGIFLLAAMDSKAFDWEHQVTTSLHILLKGLRNPNV